MNPSDPVAKLFLDYSSWYKSTYVPELIAAIGEEDLDDAWRDPLADLQPVSDVDLGVLEEEMGELPAAYRRLMSGIGTGFIFCAAPNEPLTHDLIHPVAVGEERDLLLDALDERWASSGSTQKVKAKYGFERGSFLPFLKPDETTWLFFPNARAQTDRVLLFDQNDAAKLDAAFLDEGSLETFFANYFNHLRAKDPLSSGNRQRRSVKP